MATQRAFRRRIVQPQRLDLESPGRRDYWVALEHDSMWGDHLIPLTVFVGPWARPGEGLVAFGGNHGNQYEGPIAIKHLFHDNEIDAVTGRLILTYHATCHRQFFKSRRYRIRVPNPAE